LATTVVIASELGAAREAENRLLDEVAKYRYSETCVFAIKLAVEEAVNNAIKHGNGFDARKIVDITFEVGPDRTVVTITDQGEGVRPADVADPTADENLEKPTGRGILLMHAYMDEVRYNEKGNQVCLVKRNR
jgi:serine/threonine-protein kinase RsbW